MKKALIHLSMLCLLAFLLMPLAGCNKKEENMEVEEQSSATTETTSTTTEMTSTTTEMGTSMGTDSGMGMGTETGTQGTQPPPAH
ncbi:MAG TPA: hypothetical protein VOA87_16975 [Thermoanaerobaculia bacterium]|nr:hypothetical protein [Thermoanaerobaculia bacterium]